MSVADLIWRARPSKAEMVDDDFLILAGIVVLASAAASVCLNLIPFWFFQRERRRLNDAMQPEEPKSSHPELREAVPLSLLGIDARTCSGSLAPPPAPAPPTPTTAAAHGSTPLDHHAALGRARAPNGRQAPRGPRAPRSPRRPSLDTEITTLTPDGEVQQRAPAPLGASSAQALDSGRAGSPAPGAPAAPRVHVSRGSRRPVRVGAPLEPSVFV